MRGDKVLKDSHGVIVKREKPSLFCEACRRWVETNETHNMFSSADGERLPLAVWRCPTCRGDAPAESAEAARAPVTGSDVSKDERLGPYRAAAEVVKVNIGGKTCRVRLQVCGHEACVAVGAKGVRCRVCAKDAKRLAKEEDKS